MPDLSRLYRLAHELASARKSFPEYLVAEVLTNAAFGRLRDPVPGGNAYEYDTGAAITSAIDLDLVHLLFYLELLAFFSELLQVGLGTMEPGERLDPLWRISEERFHEFLRRRPGVITSLVLTSLPYSNPRLPDLEHEMTRG